MGGLNRLTYILLHIVGIILLTRLILIFRAG
jgi:hypothetical protein